MSNITTIGVSVNPTPSAAERLDRIKIAWERVAPEATFVNLTLTQFTTMVADFKRQFEAIDSLKAGLKAGVGDHRTTALAARRLIRRVVNGVLADADYGPDSAIYRAMGFVRASERKSGSAASATNSPATADSLPAPRPTRVNLNERLEKVLSAWNEIAPEGKFAGMIMAQFQAAIDPYLKARSGLEATRTRIKAEVANKEGAEIAARKLAQRIVAAVRADEAFGDDSSLYRAMGYQPASERGRRKRTGAAPTSPTQPGEASSQPAPAAAAK